jgi:hypothetical protein
LGLKTAENQVFSGNFVDQKLTKINIFLKKAENIRNNFNLIYQPLKKIITTRHYFPFFTAHSLFPVKKAKLSIEHVCPSVPL